MDQQPDEKPSSADQQAKGLAKLKAAVKEASGVYRRPREPVKAKARRARLCSIIRPEDTYETIHQRHPEFGTRIKIAQALSVIRRMAALPGKTWLSPYAIAQGYLASLPAHYRLPTND